MPYKFNESRRHKIPKARYRVTNWPAYDAALARRGSLTVWFTEEAVSAWHAPATGERGGQAIYAAIAIETGLALRLVLHQPKSGSWVIAYPARIGGICRYGNTGTGYRHSPGG